MRACDNGAPSGHRIPTGNLKVAPFNFPVQLDLRHECQRGMAFTYICAPVLIGQSVSTRIEILIRLGACQASAKYVAWCRINKVAAGLLGTTVVGISS